MFIQSIIRSTRHDDGLSKKRRADYSS